nr:phosphotransferase family protein [Rhodococcus wratislaviensis]GLK34667.1 acyl-CoA dehydrogenase [Rhodococcus wratislaviensis]
MTANVDHNRVNLTADHLGRLTDWISSAIGERVDIAGADLVAGGRSNLTYSLRTSIGQFALRRPPLGDVSATHDVGREYNIISRLAGTPVAVPATVGLCTDADVLGTPFYVSEFVHGTVVRSAPEAEALPVSLRRTVADRLVDTLFAIHETDLAATGLDSLSRPGQYLERQLRRWMKQHELVTNPSPSLTRLHRALVECMPSSSRSTLIHGDYRLDNVMLDERGRIAAVLDWELATVGDPMCDLASLLITWSGPASEVLHRDGAPTTVSGFGDREKVLDAYEELSGRPIRDLDYYEAFAYWRQACILEGVVDRYARDMTAGDQSSVDHFPAYIESFSERASQLLVGEVR